MSLLEMIEETNETHKSFIEGNYHIRDPLLILERRAMMAESNLESGLSINPRIEASPRYEQELPLLGQGLPSEVEAILEEYIREGGDRGSLGVFNTPYTHQLRGLQAFFDNDDPKDLVVMTGTGSGKTEIFFWTILGHLAQEYEQSNDTQQRGIRTLVMYPMNALVSDQLGRMRKMMGLTNPSGQGQSGSQILANHFGRVPQFMQYTSRAPYHGPYNPGRNEERLLPLFETWRDLSNAAPGTPEANLFQGLRRKGRIPEKNLQGFIDNDYWTSAGDPELFARHEARDPGNSHGGVPDLLVTNYAMLEFMLLRPIEDPFWDETRTWLEQDHAQLLMILDEAHLYRGATGAEVALLLRRFMHRVGIDSSNRQKIRFILTSASFSDPAAARSFASQLTGKESDDFQAIEPTRAAPFEAPVGNSDDTDIEFLSEMEPVPSGTDTNLISWMAHRGWGVYDPNTDIQIHLGAHITADHLCMNAARYLEDCHHRISTLDDFTEQIFPEANHPSMNYSQRTSAALNLVNLLSVAIDANTNSNILPLRLHMMLRSLDKNFVCINPDCTSRRVQPGEDPRANEAILGRLNVGLPISGLCDCGSRMYELLTHRDCGAAYLRTYVSNTFTWPPPPVIGRPVVTYNQPQEVLKEMLLLVSPPSQNPGWRDIETNPIATGYLEKQTGILHHNITGRNTDDFLRVVVPGNSNLRMEIDGQNTAISSNTDRRATWRYCPCCTQRNRIPSGSLHGRIQDLQVKGTQPFTNILSEIFNRQPAEDDNDNPNQGRKMIAFSDSRQKAANLSIDMQEHTETERFREFMLRSNNRIIEPRPVDESHLGLAYLAFLETLEHSDISFFDREDRGAIIQGKTTKFNLQPNLATGARHPQFLEYDMRAPHQFYASLIRMFGHEDFSLRTLHAGFATFREDVMEALRPLLERFIPVENNRRAILEQIVYQAMRTFSLCHIVQVPGGILGGTQDRDHFIPSDRYGTPCKLARHWWTYSELTAFWGDANDHVSKILNRAHDLGVIPNQADIANIRQLLQQGGQIVRPSMIENNQYQLINIELLELIDSTQHTDWHRCEGCHVVSPYVYETPDGTNVCTSCGQDSLTTICPNDVLDDWSTGDLHLQSRKRHLLRPALMAVASNEPIRTLRTEEHSAQISGREDEDEEYSKTEMYELLFQEIPFGEDPQPVDVLSCTTTMEVGIDIGGITAVALRTIPPRPDNYQQRAGRAGRRGSSLSTIISYANINPHDMHHFRTPEDMIGQEPTDPRIYVENTVIAGRHCSASLLELYIREIGPLPILGGLVDAWGTAGEFFNTNPIHPHWHVQGCIDFLNTLNPTPGTLSPQAVDMLDCLPDQMFPTSSGMNEDTWLEREIQSLIEWLSTRVPGQPDELNQINQEMGLMEYLLDEMKLPKFAFPLKTTNFQAEEYRYTFENNNIVKAYNPSTDGAIALTTYAPGRVITIDKHRMISGGLVFDRQPPSRQHRARRLLNEQYWDNPDDHDAPHPSWPRPRPQYLNSCDYCQTVSSDRDQILAGEPCNACNIGDMRTLRLLEPQGFAPRHSVRTSYAALRDSPGYVSGTGYSTMPRNHRQRYTAAESRYPLEDDITGITTTTICNDHSMMYPRDEQNLLIVNDGEGNSGFEVCLDCGAIDNLGDETHWRPYVRRRAPNTQLNAQYPFQPPRCGSTYRAQFAFTHSIDSSVLVVHSRMQPPLNLFGGDNTPWFKSACESLIQATLQAASNVLGIENRELHGGWRFVPASAFGPGNAPQGATDFNLELYFHDTLPGGAGFSTRLEEFVDASGDWGMPNAIREVLACSQNCENSCTSCLQTPENQMIHDSLNRHWALQLLNYIVGQDRPQIDPHVRDMYVQQLRAVFALQNNGNTFNARYLQDDDYEFEFDGNTETFSVQSILATQIDPDVTITDLDMVSRIHEVVQRIQGAL